MAAVTKFEWNGPALVADKEKQLKAALKSTAILFHKIVQKRAEKINKGQVIKLKRKKGKSTFRKAGSRIPIYIPGVGWRMSKNVRKKGGKANRTQITIYPHSSKPGEAVRQRTGVGRKNIVAGWEGLRSRVGYTKNARYMTMHELGIKYPKGRQKRPLMVPALRDSNRVLADNMRKAADRTKP
jgi:hypothetical protein